MEGARWDTIVGGIVDANLGELLPILPVIYVKAITQVYLIFSINLRAVA